MIDDSCAVISHALKTSRANVRLLPGDRGKSCGQNHVAQRNTGTHIRVHTYSELRNLDDPRKDLAKQYLSKHNCLLAFFPFFFSSVFE